MLPGGNGDDSKFNKFKGLLAKGALKSIQKENDDPLESLHDTLVFDPRDWALSKRDAWIYAIVVGWGDSLQEVGKKHSWDNHTMDRLKSLHEKFRKLANIKTN